MNAEEFAALFDSFERSVFRLEGLQAYAEDDGFRAFRDGAARPERSVRSSPWMRRIAVTTAVGKQWSRVRLVEYPLTEYTRYELVAYIESQAVGEQVALADRAESGDLGLDFWLFDEDTPYARAVLMHYSPGGEVERYEVVNDPAGLEQLRARHRAALKHSVPLNEFIVKNGNGRIV